MVEHRVSLISFHWLSYDVKELIEYSVRKCIPYVLVNHFDNNRYSLPKIREWAEGAAGVGGVSLREVPGEYRERFVNLSDAVNTDFFAPGRAKPISAPSGFVLLLPGRVTPGKGHLDMLHCAAELVKRGFDFSIVFAGAVESVTFKQDLEIEISALNLGERVKFLGQLDTETLRDWYAISDIVVLPSHSEGLGRVLLEAQAMEKPVIGYDCGGIPDAFEADRTGLLTPKGNVSRLTEAVATMLRDEKKRILMGRQGREFVSERFSVPRLIERHESFCSNALQGLTRAGGKSKVLSK